MNILQVISSFPPAYSYGGALRVGHAISMELTRRNNEVSVYTTDVFDSNSRFKPEKLPVTMDGIKVYYFKNISNYLATKHLTLAPKMAMYLKNHIKNFNIVHLHEYRSSQAIFTHYYAKKYKIPYVLQAHGSLPLLLEKKRLKSLFDFLWGEKIVKDATRIIALNQMEADQYIKLGVDKRKISIIPNGIDFTGNQKFPKKGLFREKYSIDKNKKIILYLGRIHKIKGIDILIEAFKKVLDESFDAQLFIVGGDDGFKKNLETQINKMNFSPSDIVFTGSLFDQDKLEAFIDADVYVLPSKYEMFPMTILEAWNAGTPVITTKNCGISDMVRKAGIVVDYNADSLAEGIIKIITDKELSDKCKNNGKIILETLSWENIGQKLEKLYLDCISG